MSNAACPRRSKSCVNAALERIKCTKRPLACVCPAGLTMHASILAYMFNLVEEGKITAALNPASPTSNQVFIQEYVANLLKTAFPHLQE